MKGHPDYYLRNLIVCKQFYTQSEVPSKAIADMFLSLLDLS